MRPGLDPTTAIQVLVCAALAIAIVWVLAASAGPVDDDCYGRSTASIWEC